MAFRFRRSVKLFPGVRLNLTTRGLSATVGVRGASVNIGPTGTHLNLGLPGTGLSYRTRLDHPNRGRPNRRHPDDIQEDHFPPLSPEPEDDLTFDSPAPEVEPVSPVRPIAPTPPPDLALNDLILPSADQSGPETSFQSAGADRLTSPSLRSLSNLLVQIAAERARVLRVVKERQVSLPAIHAKSDRAHGVLARLLVNRRRRQAVEAGTSEYEKQVRDMEALLEGLAMDADFVLGDQSKDAFLDLTRAFEKMKGSEKIWDVSARRGEDSGRSKVTAASSVSRSEVTLDVANLPEIDSDYEALHFQNANGADLYLYPYFLAIPRPGGGFALMDLREITVTAQNRTITETGTIPQDALVVGYSWAKANRDGSRDQRFKGNRQIPNCYYSEIELRSASGLNEVYQFSNAHVASAFAKALAVFVSTLPAREPDSGDAGLEGHSIPTVTLPDPPSIPALMTGGLFVRLLALTAIIAGAVWINTPSGKSQASALSVRATEMVDRVVAKIRTHPAEGTSTVSVPPTSAPLTSTSVAASPPAPKVTAQTPAPKPSAPGPALVPIQPSAPVASASAAPVGAPAGSEVTASPPVSQVASNSAPSAAAPSTDVATASRPQLTANQILTLQKKLIDLGYLEGEPDTRASARMIAAFNQWRKETGKAAVTSVGPDEYAAFMRAINR
jgi:hypothetical protein